MKYKHILVAIDLSESNDQIINRAVSIAESLDAKLSFVNVDIAHPDAVLRDYDVYESANVAREHHELMTLMQKNVSNIDYPVENILIVDGEVEDKLVQTVGKTGADLLVCGHHHGFWKSLWSSSHKLVDLANVDLLLISL